MNIHRSVSDTYTFSEGFLIPGHRTGFSLFPVHVHEAFTSCPHPAAGSALSDSGLRPGATLTSVTLVLDTLADSLRDPVTVDTAVVRSQVGSPDD